MSTQNLEQLYKTDLQYLYNIEKQIGGFVPQIKDAANSSKLKDFFEKQSDKINSHVDSIETVFDNLDIEPDGLTSSGITGLINESIDLMEKSKSLDPDVFDASLISSFQRLKHYEIASYGTLRTYAKQLQDYKSEKLLSDALEEEKKADEELTELAVNSINIKAKN